ncbi:hypothetical protein NEAUS03_0193, partial [Nematocida ausubeli]
LKSIDKIENMLEKQKSINIDDFVHRYIKKDKDLKKELENMISAYMAELIKKIALSQNVSVQVSINCKRSFFGKRDVFGSARISYIPTDEQGKNAHLAHPYCYEFNICPDCSNTREELKWKTSFNMSMPYNNLEKINSPKIEKTPSIIKQIESYIDKNKQISKNCSNLDEKAQLELSYANWYEDIDTLLINPQMYSNSYKRIIGYGLILYAKEKNLGDAHPLACLADNILKSSYFMISNDKSELLIMHSLGIAEKYYPNIPINMDVYKDYPGCFIAALKNILELATFAKYRSDRRYANIITDLMIKFRETCLEDSYYSSLESFTKEISTTKRDLFVRILTRNGHSIKHVTKIVQAMQKIEKKHPVANYEKHSNQFLLWFIWAIKKNNHKNFPTVVESCCDLIDMAETERINSETFSSKWGDDINIKKLFKEIKYIWRVKEGKVECE